MKTAVYHQGFVQLGKLIRPIVNNILNFHQVLKIRSTCITMVGCLFGTCLMLKLNSKMYSLNILKLGKVNVNMRN